MLVIHLEEEAYTRTSCRATEEIEKEKASSGFRFAWRETRNLRCHWQKCLTKPLSTAAAAPDSSGATELRELAKEGGQRDGGSAERSRV